MQQQLINKKAINLKDSGEEYIGEYGGRKGKGKMKLNHYLKNKQQQKAFFHVCLWVCLLGMSLKYPTSMKF